MAKVTNKFYIQAIHDGSSVYAELINTNQLVQTITSGGVVTPDWTSTPATRPVIYPRAKVSGKWKACTGTWFYNGIELEEVTVGNTTYYKQKGTSVVDNEYYFEKVKTEDCPSDGGVKWPAIKIIRNLAGVNGNIDNDLIRFDGQVEEGGANIDFSLSRAIRITQYTSTGNFGQVLGGNSITSTTVPTVVYAVMVDPAAAVNEQTGEPQYIAPNTYKTKWYREGVDAAGNPHWYSGSNVSTYTSGPQPTAAVNAGVTLPSNCQYITVGVNDIDDYAALRCEFYDNSDNFLWAAEGYVDDMTDEFQMQVRCDSQNYIGESNIQLKSGQQADMKVWMGHNTNPYNEDTSFTSFWCKLYDNHNALITAGGSDQDSPLYNTTSGEPTGNQRKIDLDGSPATNPKYGYFDITETQMPVYSDTAHTNILITAAHGGKVSIKYAYVDRPNDDTTGKKGGDGAITGYFLALSEEDVD